MTNQYYYLISIKTNISAKYEQTKESSVVNRVQSFWLTSM